MSKKLEISDKQNIWLNGQQVDDQELTLEQKYTNQRINSIVNNHIGSGFIASDLKDKVLFDSSLYVGLLDGKPIYSQAQPDDLNYGNQLNITLTESEVNISRKVKVAIIGTNLSGELQFETFYFSKNESQITKKHYTQLLLVLFNDVSGLSNESLNLGGRCLITQAAPGFVSRDPISVSSDQEPNLFWRDFYVSGYPTLALMLKAALPLYNTDSLNIKTSSLESKIIEKNNITSFVGQKFLAKTNNIQKITLLCSVQNTTPGSETDLVWTGDMVVSIFPLQTSVSSPYDIAPNLDIEFSPVNNPLAQISFNYTTLLERGIQLSTVPQPVDFVFSNSAVANGVNIKEGSYYALAVRRSGTADKCDLLFESNSNINAEIRYTTFNNDAWVDIPDQSLWFQIYSDAIKITDGSYYDSGVGVTIAKSKVVSGVSKDYCLDKVSFSGNQSYYSYLTTQVEKSNIIQDQRTGKPTYSNKQFIPSLSLINETQLVSISNSSDPLVPAVVADKNKKTLDVNPQISFDVNHFGLINDALFIKVFDDPTSSKYNPSTMSLKTSILNGSVVGSKMYLRDGYTSNYFKVGDAIIHDLKYGDLNNDNYVDIQDFIECQKYLGLNLSTAPLATTSIVTDGTNTTYSNGYATYVNPFSFDSSISFQLINGSGLVATSNADGYLVPDPNDPSLCYFSSSAVNFSSYTGLDGYEIVLMNSGVASNYGSFKIKSIDTTTDVLTLRKYFLDKTRFLEFLQTDINGDFNITSTDINLISYFYNKSNTSSLVNRKFSVIELSLTPYVDRGDDYYSGIRGTSLHPLTDLFSSDGYFSNFNFSAASIGASLQTKLNWREDYISITNENKVIPVSIDSFITRVPENTMDIVYPTPTELISKRSSYYIDGDLFLSGDVKTKDGLHKLDIESSTIILEIPNHTDGYERHVNIFNYFVSEQSDGNTMKGYPALKFADGTFVQPDALQKNQVRFSISAQAFSPNLETTIVDGYSALIIDNRIGVYINPQGVLSLNFNNIYEDDILKTLCTRVNIQVTLKKSGFVNGVTTVSSTEMNNLLSL